MALCMIRVRAQKLSNLTLRGVRGISIPPSPPSSPPPAVVPPTPLPLLKNHRSPVFLLGSLEGDGGGVGGFRVAPPTEGMWWSPTPERVRGILGGTGVRVDVMRAITGQEVGGF